jgi:prolyl-tRNA editing enzyme YbaK/EbsC (Cys-tRNA(Pro) deacylase)
VDGRERAQRALADAGLADRIRELEESARTAAEAASALGCEVGAIGSSLVFMADEEPVLIVTSGAHRVDVERAAEHLDASRLRRATPEQVREATGYVIGGVAPVGHPSPLRILVDEDLAQYRRIWASAGHTHAVFWMTYDELLALTGGNPVRVG